MPRPAGLVLVRSRTSRRVTRTHGCTDRPRHLNRDACSAVRVCVPGGSFARAPHRARPRSTTARVRGNGPGTRKRGVHEHGSAPRPRTSTLRLHAPWRTGAGTGGRGHGGLRGASRREAGPGRARRPPRPGTARGGRSRRRALGVHTPRPTRRVLRRGTAPDRAPAPRRPRVRGPGEPTATPRLGPLPRHPTDRRPPGPVLAHHLTGRRPPRPGRDRASTPGASSGGLGRVLDGRFPLYFPGLPAAVCGVRGGPSAAGASSRRFRGVLDRCLPAGFPGFPAAVCGVRDGPFVAGASSGRFG